MLVLANLINLNLFIQVWDRSYFINIYFGICSLYYWNSIYVCRVKIIYQINILDINPMCGWPTELEFLNLWNPSKINQNYCVVHLACSKIFKGIKNTIDGVIVCILWAKSHFVWKIQNFHSSRIMSNFLQYGEKTYQILVDKIVRYLLQH